MSLPKSIHLQVKDENGVFLASIIYEFPSEVYLREAVRLAQPLLMLHADTTEVLVNMMQLKLNATSVEKGVIKNANRLRQEHYYKEGN